MYWINELITQYPFNISLLLPLLLNRLNYLKAKSPDLSFTTFILYIPLYYSNTHILVTDFYGLLPTAKGQNIILVITGYHQYHLG